MTETEKPRKKRKTVGEIYAEGFKAGLRRAYYESVLLADNHRAINLNAGNVLQGVAISSVAAFIVQTARQHNAWSDSLRLPLVLSNREIAEIEAKDDTSL